MSPAELLAHPVSQAVTWTLLHFVWQGILIAAALVAAVELLRLRRPGDRYLCSLAALLLMATCPLVTLVWQADRSLESGLRTQEPGIAALTTHHIRHTLSPPPTDRSSPTHLLQAVQPYFLAAWLTGVVLLGGRLLLGLAGVQRLRKSRLPLPSDLARRTDDLSRRLAMGRRNLVFLSSRVSEAMAVGLIRPIVLIPAAWATEMPLAMLEAVIAHELAHLRRQDLWFNFLQRIVETLLFYHPAVWWLSRRLRTERELCCDELAVAATGQRLVYVQALEQVARRHAAGVQPVLAAGIRGERNMRLLERVRNVLGLSADADRSRLWPAGLLVLALPLGVWAWSAGLIANPAAAVAADDREDDDDDDDDDREEGRKGDREDDDDDDDGKEGRDKEDDDDDEKEGREKKEADDDDEKEGAKSKEREDDDGDEKEGAKDKDGDDVAEKKEVRKDGDRGERKEVIKRDGDKREIRIEVRREEIRKDRDRPGKEGPRDDEPRKEGPRDGEIKKPGLRDGEVKKPGSRDGEVKKPGLRDGDKPVKEGERKVVRDGDKPGKDMEAYVNELTALIKKLQVENERLRAELAGRGDKVKEGASFREKEGAAREKESYAREVEAEFKRAAAEKEEAIRRAIKAKEFDGEREAAERKELEARERKIKEAALKDGARKEGDERELIEKKRAQAERAAKEDAKFKEERAKEDPKAKDQ